MTSSLSSSRLLPSLAALATAAVIASAALAPSWAAPLDAETCTKVMTEHQQLETAGVEQDMAKGPEWAKANLGPERLSQVRRFIELEELILFRCRSKTLVTLPPDPETPPAATKDKAGNDTAPARPDTKDTVAPKAAPKAAADGPAAGRKAKTPPAAPEPKQKAPAARKPAPPPGKTEARKKPEVPAKAAAAAQPTDIDREANTSSFAKSSTPRSKARPPAGSEPGDAAN